MSRSKHDTETERNILRKHALWFIDELDKDDLRPAQRRLDHMLHLIKTFFPTKTDP